MSDDILSDLETIAAAQNHILEVLTSLKDSDKTTIEALEEIERRERVIVKEIESLLEKKDAGNNL